MNRSELSRQHEAAGNLHFRLMSLMYKFRDFFRPRMKILTEVGIKPSSRVLDYGCGPGSYVTPLAELVGPFGAWNGLKETSRRFQAVLDIFLSFD